MKFFDYIIGLFGYERKFGDCDALFAETQKGRMAAYQMRGGIADNAVETASFEKESEDG